MHGAIAHVRLGALRWRLQGGAWGAPTPASVTTDATLVMAIELDDARSIEARVHLRLVRPDATWRCPWDDVDAVARAFADHAYASCWRVDETIRRLVLVDAGYALAEIRPSTQAARWAGAASARVEALLGPEVRSEGWMQDWPLEVSSAHLLPAACAAYDLADDDDHALRFDLMALAVACQDRNSGSPSPWFEPRLIAGIAILGHQIHERCYWERDGDGDDDWMREPETLVPLMRRVWTEALVPIELAPTRA